MVTKRRSLLAALAVSVLLHVVALVWAARQPPPPVVRLASEPLEVLVLTEEDVAPAPPPAPQAERPLAEPPRPPASRPRPEAPRPEAPRPEAEARVEAGAPAPEEAAVPHAPRLEAAGPPAGGLSLVPGGDFVVPPGLGRGGGAPAATAGRTVRPGDEEPESERLARQGAQVKARVEAWSADQLAELRVERGLLDPYFAELRHALDAQVKEPPKELKVTPITQKLFDGYVSQLQRYGATGAPHADVALGERRDVSSSSVSQVAEREAARDPSLYKGGFLVAPGQLSPEAAAQKAELRAVVEVRVASDGRLTGQVLLESSGNGVFDRFVMGAVPGALSRLTPPPQGGSGIRADGVRAVWEFQGRVTLKKKVRDFKLPEDLPYLTAALGLGQLAGGFDLTSMKDMEVVDLRDPRWKLSSRLLRVY